MATRGDVAVGWAHRMRATVEQEGTSGQPHFKALLADPDLEAGRAGDDLVHHLCALYGRRPGLIDHVAGSADGQDEPWLGGCAVGFALERDLLARLASAVGAIPGTPGQAASEAASVQQRQTVELLARSERRGCALGAAGALMIDWALLRPLLDALAVRAGIAAAPIALPSADRICAKLDSQPAERTRGLNFGAEQLLAQQRGLWALLEARHLARGRS